MQQDGPEMTVRHHAVEFRLAHRSDAKRGFRSPVDRRRAIEDVVMNDHRIAGVALNDALALSAASPPTCEQRQNAAEE
jgi:hypothetical protein